MFGISIKVLLNSITNQLLLLIKRREVQEQEATSPSSSGKTIEEDQKGEAVLSWKQLMLLKIYSVDAAIASVLSF